MWTGFNSPRIGSIGGLLNEPSGSIAGREFLDYLSSYQFSRAPEIID
jgi:hypothetical protein